MAQSDLPSWRQLWMHKYAEEKLGRLFSVKFFDQSLKEHVRLYELYVLDDKSIKITSDDRVRLYEVGRRTEDRFFQAMEVRTPETPDWFLRVRKAGLFFDQRGIDAFALVTFRPGEKRLKIPIQIKSSVGGVLSYRGKHPLCTTHGVVTFVLRHVKTDDYLRQMFYRALFAVRHKKIQDGTRFTELHTLLHAGHR